jgi:heme/copper-type cytochrome/quinol oxidase subunit 4
MTLIAPIDARFISFVIATIATDLDVTVIITVAAHVDMTITAVVAAIVDTIVNVSFDMTLTPNVDVTIETSTVASKFAITLASIVVANGAAIYVVVMCNKKIFFKYD